MQRFEKALEAYKGGLSLALQFNLGALSEVQSVLKPFFPDGWMEKTVPLKARDLIYVLNEAAIALHTAHPQQAWTLLEKSIKLQLERFDASQVATGLRNLAWVSWNTNKLAEAFRLRSLAFEIGKDAYDEEEIFAGKLSLFAAGVEFGDQTETDRLWRELSDLGRNWSRAKYRPGDAEKYHIRNLFYRGELTEDVLVRAERLASKGRNRGAIQELFELRGSWQLAKADPQRAVDSLVQAVGIAREFGRHESRSEALLLLAKLRSGARFDVRAEVERLGESANDAALTIAEIWHAIGDHAQARQFALRAYRWAIADGEPYVRRYHLTRAKTLCDEMNMKLASTARYDPSKITQYPWETAARTLSHRYRRRV
jgi:hypothetical protein